jgi:hypothetical protein
MPACAGPGPPATPGDLDRDRWCPPKIRRRPVHPMQRSRTETTRIQGDLVWTVSGPVESAPRGHDVSRGFNLRRPPESLGEPSQVRPTVVSSRLVGRAQCCSPEILIAAHIAMPAPVAPFVTETRGPAPGARTPLPAPAGTCGTRSVVTSRPAHAPRSAPRTRTSAVQALGTAPFDETIRTWMIRSPGLTHRPADCARQAARRGRRGQVR